ncbi:glycosyltransferase family 39 protein [Streptomyces justiciae]|uniref:glycosyltransferase family 39 protein n=1 Tax=Streptomyces justiciae TaxID=2780140 RepID=UPI002117CDE2|nr:glycosyltransferase family 39 protein [Streptomyces justiciae]MCW8384268.1 glycosyltransferase family 39 protein [Streptomyces justiciae]
MSHDAVTRQNGGYPEGQDPFAEYDAYVAGASQQQYQGQGSGYPGYPAQDAYAHPGQGQQPYAEYAPYGTATPAAPVAPVAPAPVAPEPSAEEAGEDEPEDAKGGRFATAVTFLLPTVLAFGMIWRGIGDRELWRDEHATWWAATLSFHDLSQLIRSIDVVFTPYYVMMHIWIAVAGDSPTAMRIPGAVAMAASAGLLALLGRRLFTTQVGVTAGLAFAVVPLTTRYGQEIRPYAFAVAAVLLSTLLLARALDRPSFKGWIAYTVSVPLIGWSHLASLAVLAPHLAMVLLKRRAGDRIVGWAYFAACGLGVCFVTPMAISGSGQSGQIAWNNPVLQDLIDFPKNLFGSWAVAVPVMALGVIGLFFAGRWALPLALWIVLPPVATYATAAQLHLFLPRYLLFTAPAWVLLASVAVGRLAGPVVGAKAGSGAAVRRGLGWALAAAAVAGLAFQALPGLRETRHNALGEPDFRGAARIVLDEQRKGDGIAFSGVMSERRAMDYELRDAGMRPRDVLMYRTPQQQASFGATECPHPRSCLVKAKRLWVVSTTLDGQPFSGMPKATQTAVEKTFRVVKTRKLDSLQLVLLERRKGATGDSAEDQDDAARRKVHA